MSKKLISLLLVLILSASVIAVGSISSSAAGNTTITVGTTNYSASVGDIVTYRLTVTYPEARIATAQIELPVNFSILEGPSQEDLDNIFGENNELAAYRYDTANTKGIVGYVGSYVSYKGIDCSAGMTVLELSFKVIKAGSTNLHAGFRYVSDVNDKDIVNHKGTVLDDNFSYTESLTVSSGSLYLDGTVQTYLNASDEVKITLSEKDSGETVGTFTGSGNILDYSFEVSSFSKYTLTVEKRNHVTRSFDVQVNEGDVQMNLKINPLGDSNLNGAVDIKDVNALYKHVMQTKLITDEYALECSDVAKAFKTVDIKDVNALYKHVMQTKKLYEV